MASTSTSTWPTACAPSTATYDRTSSGREHTRWTPKTDLLDAARPAEGDHVRDGQEQRGLGRDVVQQREPRPLAVERGVERLEHSRVRRAGEGHGRLDDVLGAEERPRRPLHAAVGARQEQRRAAAAPSVERDRRGHRRVLHERRGARRRADGGARRRRRRRQVLVQRPRKVLGIRLSEPVHANGLLGLQDRLRRGPEGAVVQPSDVWRVVREIVGELRCRGARKAPDLAPILGCSKRHHGLCTLQDSSQFGAANLTMVDALVPRRRTRVCPATPKRASGADDASEHAPRPAVSCEGAGRGPKSRWAV